jgi:hypothetical protein
MPIAPLVADDDPDLAGWQSGDQSVYLRMVMAEIRKFCGWHIAPNVTETGKRCWLGARGLIMLPSTFVTSVDQVTIDGQVMVSDQDYFWDQPKPWIHRKVLSWPQDQFALITFEHGYDETPSDVKAVVFEVMATAMELPASNASRVQTMQYNFDLNPDIGVALSNTQKNRLGKYRIVKFGGQP